MENVDVYSIITIVIQKKEEKYSISLFRKSIYRANTRWLD